MMWRVKISGRPGRPLHQPETTRSGRFGAYRRVAARAAGRRDNRRLSTRGRGRVDLWIDVGGRTDDPFRTIELFAQILISAVGLLRSGAVARLRGLRALRLLALRSSALRATRQDRESCQDEPCGKRGALGLPIPYAEPLVSSCPHSIVTLPTVDRFLLSRSGRVAPVRARASRQARGAAVPSGQTI